MRARRPAQPEADARVTAAGGAIWFTALGATQILCRPGSHSFFAGGLVSS